MSYTMTFASTDRSFRVIGDWRRAWAYMGLCSSFYILFAPQEPTSVICIRPKARQSWVSVSQHDSRPLRSKQCGDVFYWMQRALGLEEPIRGVARESWGTQGSRHHASLGRCFQKKSGRVLRRMPASNGIWQRRKNTYTTSLTRSE